MDRVESECKLFLRYLCQEEKKKREEKKNQSWLLHTESFPAANCHLFHRYFLLGCCLSPT